VLTGDQHDEFRVTGLLRLGGAFRPAAAEAMCDRLLVAPYLGLGEAFRLDRVRTGFAAHPWLGGLWKPGDGGDRIQRYMYDGTIIDGVPLRVVELTGEPGDVILMHSDCFHAVAPNRLTQPRMMLTDMVSPDQSDSCRSAGHDQGRSACSGLHREQGLAEK